MNRKHLVGVLSVCMCAAMGITACSGDDSGSDCGSGQSYVDGKCVDIDSENDKSCDPACDESETCEDGECKPKEVACDPACDFGEICVDGKCRADEAPEPEKTCEPACRDNEICQSGVCVEPDNPIVGEIRVSTNQLTTIQTLANAEFSVVLSSAPENKVVIPVKSSNASAGTLSVETVELTADNWEAGQVITVTGAADKLPEDVTNYQIVVGPSQSEDKNFDGLEAVNISVSHYNLPEKLSLDKTEASLLLRKVKKTSAHDDNNSVTFTVILPEDKKNNKVVWKIENANSADSVSLKDLVQIGEDCESGASTCTITRLNIDLLSEENLTKKLDLARTINVSVSSEGCGSAEAKLYLKPYLPTGFNYGYITSNVKDLGYNAAKKTKGNLSCHYYDFETLKVLNEDLHNNYVIPNMYKNEKGELLPTRASVVAAARFLVLQFPRDIPYSGTTKHLKFDGIDKVVNDSGRMTLSSYVWTQSTIGKGKTYKDYALYGLSLTSNGYNEPLSFEDSNVVANDLDAWGCSYEEFFKNKYKSKEGYEGKSFKLVDSNGKDTSAIYAGMCCSAFVSWAIHNGMFDIGNVYTSAFAKTYKEGKVVGRNYQFEDKLYSSPKINSSVNAFEKLQGLKEEDIISLDKIDKKNTVGMKAGDLLWYSGACTCKDSQKCPEECTCDSGGHLAMILGIYKKSGEISTIYVAEAQDAGNRLTYHYIDSDPKIANWNKSSSSCKEIKLIKMGNVYNYYTDKGDTWNYTDNWF